MNCALQKANADSKLGIWVREVAIMNHVNPLTSCALAIFNSRADDLT